MGWREQTCAQSGYSTDSSPCLCCGNDQWCDRCGSCNICTPGEVRKARAERDKRQQDQAEREARANGWL